MMMRIDDHAIRINDILGHLGQPGIEIFEGVFRFSHRLVAVEVHQQVNADPGETNKLHKKRKETEIHGRRRSA